MFFLGFLSFFLHVIYSRFWYAFSMLKLTKFPPPYWGGLTFYYTDHDMNRFISHVHCARPLNGFENGPNLAENKIEYVWPTTWDGIFIYFLSEPGSARFAKIYRRARPGSQKLPLNRFTGWNFLRNKTKSIFESGINLIVWGRWGGLVWKLKNRCRQKL